MTSARLLAEWDHDPGCSCSRTSLGCCLRMAGTLWPVSFRAWPRSAMSSRTGLYELPTLEPLTGGSGGSASRGLLPTPVVTNRAGMEPSPATERGTRGTDLGPAIGELLKTPTAQLAINGGSQHPDKRRAGGHGPTLADQVEHELLPTPVAADAERASATYSRGNPTLAGALLPAPRATDGAKGGPNQRGSSGDLMLPSAVMELLPTPSAAVATGGQRSRSGKRKGEPLLGGIAMLLPTPAAHDSGNTPESHLSKKPGRSQVTSLQVIAEHGLIETGGRLLPTPTAMDSHGARNATARRSELKKGVNNDGWTLSDVFWTGDLTSPPSGDGKPS